MVSKKISLFLIEESGLKKTHMCSLLLLKLPSKISLFLIEGGLKQPDSHIAQTQVYISSW